jgi:nucleotide-binding universal stress UspA family protein
MYEDILLPTDGSASMDVVIEQAADIAARRGATVHALYVVDDRAFLTLDDELTEDVLTEFETEGESATRAVADALSAEGVEVRTVLRRGDPADEILDYVAAAGVDLITMGTHGAEFNQNILGSVSQKVVAMSEVPVLTVRVNDGGA